MRLKPILCQWMFPFAPCLQKRIQSFSVARINRRMMETTTMMKMMTMMITDQEVLVSRESRAILEIQENLEYEKISSQYSIWSLHSSSCWSASLFFAPLLPIKGNIEIKIVKSGSMEPAIKTGSIVVIKPASLYGVGDVITFGEDSRTTYPTTHRI